MDFGSIAGGSVDEGATDSQKTKPDFGSADWWIATVTLALQLAKQVGVLHKKEGYDPKQDQPRDKDSGEELY